MNRPPSVPIALFLTLAFVAPASLAADRTGGGAGCEAVYVEAVGLACRTGDGLWTVTLDDGTVLTTHGPDPRPDGEDGGVTAAAERAPRCSTDFYQHVLYGRPASQADRFATLKGPIQSYVRSMNAVLNTAALASGAVNADYKVLCDGSGAIQVGSFVVSSNSADFSAVVSAARSAGFNKGNVDYTIFYDASHPSYCGVGSYYSDDRLTYDNPNNRGGSYGVTYQGCWTGRTPMHENGHNQGAVQTLAPDSDLSGHCLEGADIMCYPTSSILVLCPGTYRYDCDYDTYFDAKTEPGEWLASHWNIGSRLNRFVAFSDTSPPTNAPPVAVFAATVSGSTVSVDASASTDADGDPLTFAWTFGDGGTGAGVADSHVYAATGTYTVGLEVSDGRGGLATTSRLVTIAEDVPPHVDAFSFQGFISCSVAAHPIATRDLCASDPNAVQDFEVPFEAGLTGLHVELRWTPAAGIGGSLLSAKEMTYLWTRPAGLPSNSGASPLVGDHAVDPNGPVAASDEGILHVRPSGTSGLVFGQPFEACVALLYGGATLPADYTCDT